VYILIFRVTNGKKSPAISWAFMLLTRVPILCDNYTYQEREIMNENELADLETMLKVVQEKWDANDRKIKESASRVQPYTPGKTGELIRLKEQQVELEQEIEVLKTRIRLLKSGI
jgi:hypothetical protein